METSAIKFFENEIYHYNIMLNGIMNPEYREYILAKKAYYEIAIKAIKEQQENLKVEQVDFSNMMLEFVA